MHKILFAVLLLTSLPLWAAEVIIQTQNAMVSIEAEIADTPEKAAQGLMYRTDLKQNTGMLFIHDTDRIWNMWMKNTLIGLDILFFDRHGKIVKIIREARPMDLTILSSDQPVAGVLEIGAKEAERLNIAPGDTLVIPRF